MGLKIGQRAPDFTLPSTSGKDFKFYQDTDNQSCIIYFYPKDFTQGCTAEACEFRNHFEDFKGLDIPIYGISRDSIDTHQDFIRKYKLPFELLSDKSGKVCKAYDALVPIIGIPKRITYLIAADKKILAVFSDMFNAQKHISEMLSKAAK